MKLDDKITDNDLHNNHDKLLSPPSQPPSHRDPHLLHLNSIGSPDDLNAASLGCLLSKQNCSVEEDMLNNLCCTNEEQLSRIVKSGSKHKCSSLYSGGSSLVDLNQALNAQKNG